jgi:signal transduction histidine kinase
MLQAITKSVRRKLMLVILATTFTALLVAAISMLVYEQRTYKQSVVSDLTTQADIIGRTSASALAFDDPTAAQETLSTLETRPQVSAAAIYTAKGSIFAGYVANGTGVVLPTIPELDGYHVQGDQVTLFHRIVAKNEFLGTVYLQARFQLYERLRDYLGILAAVTALALLVALLMSLWLQATLTKPILAVTDVARQVIERRDFSLRVRKTTDDEIGYLVDAFNAMLAEVGRRADALETSNRTLQQEMAERRGAEQALRRADRHKNEFLATLAHELRNPLAPIRNALYMLRIAGDDRVRAGEMLQIMERQLQQMVRLIDDLLDVSRITTGKLMIKKEDVDLSEVIRNAVEAKRPMLADRKHTLKIEVPPDAVHLEGDPVRLAQVFTNLLDNAAKYTMPGGLISVVASLEGDEVVVRITDSGIGIARDMLSEIFEMFTQVDRSLERSTAGLGVGLSLVRRLVELHGGSVSAHSEGVDKGSTLVVRLPVTSKPPETTPPAAPGADHGVTRHRILVADDNVDYASSIALILRTMGHEVRVANDGRQALEMAAGFRPDYAFLDIGMPEMNGYDLARRMRELGGMPRLVLVAVTGWAQDDDRDRVRQAGFDYHLVKPADPAQLQAILRDAS